MNIVSKYYLELLLPNTTPTYVVVFHGTYLAPSYVVKDVRDEMEFCLIKNLVIREIEDKNKLSS